MENRKSQSNDGGTLRTRVSLLFRLRDWQNGRTWREFYDLYYNYVYRHARGSGLDHHEAEEVTQEVFLSVSKKIETFEPHPRPGSFRNWLGKLARWRVTDKLRERGKPSSSKNRFLQPDQSFDAIDQLPAPPEPEALRLESEWQTELYETALQRIARKVDPKKYQIFHLHHRDDWPLKRIARELRITRASAYVINHRIKKLLQREIQTLKSNLE